MAFKAFEEVSTPLTLPIGAKEYSIPPIGIADGIALTEHLSPTSKEPPMTNDQFRRLVLGTAFDEMVADNAPALGVALAAQTALVDFQTGRAAAEIFWETGGDPKGMTARLEEAKAALISAATIPQGAASTTKRRASGSGTKTSRKR